MIVLYILWMLFLAFLLFLVFMVVLPVALFVGVLLLPFLFFAFFFL